MSDPLFNVDREIVVLTGVAGQLGTAYATAFLQRGACVAGLDLEGMHDSSAVLDLQKKYASNFSFIGCDITNVQSLQTALSKMTQSFGEPTVLINNAAIDSPPDAPVEETGPFETYPDDSWDKIMDVNLKGVYLACKVFGGVMAANQGGSIINVSSIYGVVSPDQSIYDYRKDRGEVFFKPVAYSVSKSGVLNLTRYLATYWARQKVRVNTLVIAGVFNHQEAEFLEAYCSRIPVGRMAEMEEYNGAVLFLASKASVYMTGAQLTIDGGWTAI